MRSDLMRPRSTERESHASPSRRSRSSCSIADDDNRTGTRASPSGARSRRSATVLRGVTRRPVLARDSILVNACDRFADGRDHRSFTNRTHAASTTRRIINRYQVPSRAKHGQSLHVGARVASATREETMRRVCSGRAVHQRRARRGHEPQHQSRVAEWRRGYTRGDCGGRLPPG